MNVLHVIASLSHSQGGLRSTLLAMLEALALVGARCTVCTLDDGGAPLPGVIERRHAPSGLRRLGHSRAMRRWLGSNARHYDVLIAHGLWLAPTVYATQVGRPCLIRPAGMLLPDALHRRGILKRLRWWQAVGGAVRRSQLLFSTGAERDLSLEFVPESASRTHVCPNPVAQDFFEVVAAEREAPPRVMCLNRIHPRKGVEPWVRALAELLQRGVALRGEHAGEHEDKAETSRVMSLASPLVARGALTFRGGLRRGALLQLLARADVLVHPATGWENFGNVCAEAMAAGVPVVCSRRALIARDAAAAGALIACQPEPSALADALEPLLRDATLRAALAARGRNYAREHFTPAAVGSQLREILERVADNRA